MTEERLIEIKDLVIGIADRIVVNKVNIEIRAGKVLALVGESGSGKTITGLSMLNLLPPAARIISGIVSYRGTDITRLKGEEMRSVRGKKIAMVFQEPFTALNPVMKIGDQVREVLIAHGICDGQASVSRVSELLDKVKLPGGASSYYPHELSGGMRQRAMIAMALAGGPEVLILDEPTTALDVSLQKEILDLIRQIQDREKFGILFISHDFSVVNILADEICVMKSGSILEKGNREKVLRSPEDEYTKHLINCIPRLRDERERLPSREMDILE